ncbi:unnamed protein product [Urochloa humidicola]
MSRAIALASMLVYPFIRAGPAVQRSTRHRLVGSRWPRSHLSSALYYHTAEITTAGFAVDDAGRRLYMDFCFSNLFCYEADNSQRSN